MPSGGFAATLTPEQELRRAVLACLLWEDNAYESGVSIVNRIMGLVPQNAPTVVADLAIEARERMHLRHVPLLLVREMTKYPEHKRLVGDTLARVIQRADEPAEFLALYWQAEGRERPRELRANGRFTRNAPLAKQVKRGLATAFRKFNAYALAKNDKDGPVKLADALSLCHAEPRYDSETTFVDSDAIRPRPRGQETGKRRHMAGQGLEWQQLLCGTLPTPNTWEVRLSAGEDKRQVWESLIAEEMLGEVALMRNLRNMEQAGVPQETVDRAIDAAPGDKLLPFQVYAAYRHATRHKDALEGLLLRTARLLPRLSGRTALAIDVSGSMDTALSDKSELTRLTAAAALAAVFAECCETPRVYATADSTGLVTEAHERAYRWRNESFESNPNARGFELARRVEGARGWAGCGGIYTVKCLNYIRQQEGADLDRVIVLTDGQDCGSDRRIPDIAARQYTINVASHQHQVAYGERWLQIDGWSDFVVRYVAELEALESEVQA